jgi:hypothetical protein
MRIFFTEMENKKTRREAGLCVVVKGLLFD